MNVFFIGRFAAKGMGEPRVSHLGTGLGVDAVSRTQEQRDFLPFPMIGIADFL